MDLLLLQFSPRAEEMERFAAEVIAQLKASACAKEAIEVSMAGTA